MNKTVFDLWDMDLKILPDEKCTEKGKRKTGAGIELTDYALALEKPSMGLFTNLIVSVSQEGRKIFTFTNPRLGSIKVTAVRKLVDALSSVYGKDNNPRPRGEFNDNDDLEVTRVIADPAEEKWPGRMWTLNDHSVMVTVAKEGLTLFIHGTPQAAQEGEVNTPDA